jgi:hypothetical protein
MNWVVECADVLEWCESYRGPKFHASLGDWPYELCFMNRKWDASGISFQVETWAALAEHLYPGAFIMAFGGSRTYHRLAVAAEDAGLIIHPCLGWLQSQGFPKATKISSQLDDKWAMENYGGWCECNDE